MSTTTTKRGRVRGRYDNISIPADMRKHIEKVFGPFDYDPCPLDWKVDGLNKDIRWGKRNYMHPPNSQCAKWIERAVYETIHHGAQVTAFVAAKTNTSYWQKWVLPYARDIRFVRKSVTFVGFSTPMPIAYAVIQFAPSDHVIKHAINVEKLHLGSKYSAWRLIKA